jgi:hypothetical protein
LALVGVCPAIFHTFFIAVKYQKAFLGDKAAIIHKILVKQYLKYLKKNSYTIMLRFKVVVKSKLNPGPLKYPKIISQNVFKKMHLRTTLRILMNLHQQILS